MTDTTATTDSIDDWTTTEALAQQYHVSSRTIRRLCASGAVPAVRVGRQWRIRRSDWDQYLVDWVWGGHEHEQSVLEP